MNFWQIFGITIGSCVVLMPTLAWLTKTIINHFLSKDIEIYKKTIEFESAKEIERLRSSLQITANEHEIKFNKLHEKRAVIIEEAYQLLVALEQSLNQLNWPLGTNRIDAKKQRTELNNEQWRAFYKFFERNRLYFSVESCNGIDSVLKRADDMITDWVLVTNSPSESTPQTFQEWEKRWRGELDLIRKFKCSIEKDFQKILGL